MHQTTVSCAGCNILSVASADDLWVGTQPICVRGFSRSVGGDSADLWAETQPRIHLIVDASNDLLSPSLLNLQYLSNLLRLERITNVSLLLCSI